MIVVRLQGGLGNQMFQYSAGRALSLRHGVPLAFDVRQLLDRKPLSAVVPRDFELDIFNIEGQKATAAEVPLLFRGGRQLDRLRSKTVRHSGLERHFHFNPHFEDLGARTYLEGYWQSPRYFENYAATIRRDLVLRDPLPRHIEREVAVLSEEPSVCLHIRRGDFVGSAFHAIPGLDYYESALAVVARHGFTPRVHVFSDDVEWCRHNVRFQYETSFFDNALRGPKASWKFAMMMACRAFIISNSTFSWWAAWLASHKDKIVIAPQTWFVDKTIDTTDLFPDGWLRI